MMVDASRLSETLQSLVDARLDTVDRMLIGRVNRQDRLAIVREVETQIFDLIDRHGQAELDRDDILAILGRLDPPEAYLPEESSGQAAVRPGRVATRNPDPESGGKEDRVSFRSGVLGLISIGMILVGFVGFLFENLIQSQVLAVLIVFGITGSLFFSGLLAVLCSAYARFRGPWSIVGLVTGIIALTTGSAMVCYVLFNSL